MTRKTVSTWLTQPVFERLEPRLLLSASITVAKPGMAVHHWDATAGGYEYLDSGSIQIGHGDLDAVEPVYQFDVPRLGDVAEVAVRVVGDEAGSSGTDIYIGGYHDASWVFGEYTASITMHASDDVISGKGDTDTLADYVEVKFVNSWTDNLIIDEIEVTVTYADIPESNARLIGIYQGIYDAYTVLSSYHTNVGPMLWDMDDYAADEIYEEGIQKAYAVADALSELNGFSISGLDISDWGTWVATIRDIKGSLTSAWNLWDALRDLILVIDTGLGKLDVINDIRPAARDLVDAAGIAAGEMRDLASQWQDAAQDGQILGDERTLIERQIGWTRTDLEWLGGTEQHSGRLGYYRYDTCDTSDNQEMRKGYLNLTKPLATYRWGDSKPEASVVGNYLDFLDALEADMDEIAMDPPGAPSVSAQTNSAGSYIPERTWQRDDDPYFHWSTPDSDLPLDGYSVALSTQPDETPDTWNTCWEYSSGALPNGTHTFYVKARDTAGQWGPVGSFTIWVDDARDTIPGLAAKTSGGGTVIAENTWQQDDDPYFHWTTPTSTSPIVGYSYAIDGQPGNSVNAEDAFHQVPGGALANGERVFRVKAKDAAGNWGPVSSFTIKVDDQGDPIVSISARTHSGGGTISEGVWQQDDDPYLSWSAQGAHSPIVAYDYAFDSQPNGSQQTPHSFLGVAHDSLATGVHTFNVRARDEAGNWGPAASFTLKVDDTPPTVGTILIADGATVTLNDVVSLGSLAGVDDHSGVEAMRFSNEGAVWSGWEPAFPERSDWDLSLMPPVWPAREIVSYPGPNGWPLAFPDMAVDAQGRCLLAYMADTAFTGDELFGMYGRFLDVAGSQLGDPIRLVPDRTFLDGLNYPAVAMIPGGGFVLAWGDYRRTYDPPRWSTLLAQLHDRYGRPVGNEIEVAFALEDSETEFIDPCVLTDSSGRFAVLWVENTSDSYVLWRRFFGSDGVPLGPPAVLMPPMAYGTAFSAGMQANGEFVVAWRRDESPGSFVAQRFDASGTPIGPTVAVASAQSGIGLGRTAVAMGPGGDFVVFWQELSALPYEPTAMYARLYDAAGDARGDVMQLGPTGWLEAAAMDSRGDVTVVWTEHDDSGSRILARRYRTPGTCWSGTKEVFVEYRDAAGNVGARASDTIRYFNGPYVLSQDPAGFLPGAIDHVDVVFSDEIVSATLDAVDVVVTGPGGWIGPASVADLGGNTFRVSFPVQTETGRYSVRIGPEIEDAMGILMDQDLDDVHAETDDDAYVAELAITVLGDADLDGIVDYGDYLAAKDGFGTASGAGWPDGDTDGDGDVDWRDYLTVKQNFGHSVGAGGVGEPQAEGGTAPPGVILAEADRSEAASPAGPVVAAGAPDGQRQCGWPAQPSETAVGLPSTEAGSALTTAAAILCYRWATESASAAAPIGPHLPEGRGETQAPRVSGATSLPPLYVAPDRAGRSMLAAAQRRPVPVRLPHTGDTGLTEQESDGTRSAFGLQPPDLLAIPKLGFDHLEPFRPRAASRS